MYEKNVPTKNSKKSQKAWISEKNENHLWKGDYCKKTSSREEEIGLIEPYAATREPN
jgi:hypothetical protein